MNAAIMAAAHGKQYGRYYVCPTIVKMGNGKFYNSGYWQMLAPACIHGSENTVVYVDANFAGKTISKLIRGDTCKALVCFDRDSWDYGAYNKRMDLLRDINFDCSQHQAGTLFIVYLACKTLAKTFRGYGSSGPGLSRIKRMG